MRIGWATGAPAIGLDIGRRAIKAATMDRAGTRLEGAVRLPRSTPDGAFTRDEAVRVREVLERRGFAGRAVVLAAPSDALVESIVDLPPVPDDATLARLAVQEVARTQHWDASSFELGVWRLPEGVRREAGVSTMAAALRHDEAEKLCAPLAEAGLRVVAIRVPGVTLAAGATRWLGEPAPRQVDILADLGWSGTRIAVLIGGTMVYERRIPEISMRETCKALMDGSRIPEDLAEIALVRGAAAKDATPDPHVRRAVGALAAALSREVGVSMDFASHRYAQSTKGRLLLCGGGADVADLPGALAPSVDAEVLVVGPDPAGAAGDAGRGAVALAASLAMEAGSGRARRAA